MSDDTQKNMIQKMVLETLQSFEKIEDGYIFAVKNKLNYQELVSIIKSLEANLVISLDNKFVHQEITLTDEGRDILQNGSPEYRLFSLVGPEGVKQKDLPSDLFQKGFRHLSGKFLKLEKGSGKVERLADQYEDRVQYSLQLISQGGEILVTDQDEFVKKRKLVTIKEIKSNTILKGPQFRVNFTKPETELTKQMIIDGSWADKVFKPYNFDSLGTPNNAGFLHPMMKVREEYRQIFIELGFVEMQSQYVESSFWNFDTLFQPQQHPARDAHDTFFLNVPQTTHHLPEDYVKLVKDAHEHGSTGSIGWRYKWSLDEAKKNILRTHTTSTSSRMLYKLAKDGFKPKKYFSIDRVYRNETLDATHLAEFHQIEGLVADYDLGLRDLMGMLETFYHKIGIKQLRFKPAYNPYTEPSMEVFGYHDGLQRWIELGNSGIFRPEMLEPMGLPENVKVIAWGLSLERPTMIKYGYKNIRELVGYKTKITFIQTNPFCRMDI